MRVSIIWNTTEEEDDEWYRQQIEYVRTQVEQLGKKDINREQEANSIRSEWKRELFLLFEDPSSSRRAFWVNIFVTIMIIFSAVLSTIETIPSMREGHPHLWFNLEALVVVIFTIEFILRACGHSGTVRQFFRHILSFLTIVDIVAIVPFYIELMLKKDTSYEFRFTILRILRLLRVFSAFKYSSLLQLSIEVMIVSFKRSADALMALLLFSVLIIVLFSTLMYFAERGVWDENSGAFLDPSGEYSQFTSIPAAAWYMAVTLTTTGFGDMTPKTFVGKLISFPAMMCGILLIALPSIIVGRNFTQVWEAARKYRGVGKPNQRSQVMPDGTVVVDDQVGGPLVTGSSLSAGGSTSHTPRSGGVVIGAANSSMRNRRHTDSLVGTGEGASGKSRASINNRSKVHNDNISLALQKTRNDNWDVDRSLSSRRGFDPIKEFSRRGSFEIDNDETLFDHPSGYKPLENDDEAADDYKGKSRDDDGLNISYDGSKDTSSAEDQVVVIAKKEWQQLQVEFETLKQSNKETRQLLEQILEIVAADKNQQLAQASEQ
ncbi:hypothetical protein H4219_004144 [Mycoemilia scoparia]|uniref:Ion transport domain-containing protein n=1 Tax=Mycoemilia scoparia TaxID=417184 RepID=A0A9W8A227_9FUNG|nr:hypothetical protein H4219_004144 [Mycoemilia scoparia]